MNHQVVVMLLAAHLALASGQQSCTKPKPSSLLQRQVRVRGNQHLQLSDEEKDAGVHAKYLRSALVMVKELASNVTDWDTNLRKSERDALNFIKGFIDDLSKSAIESHDEDQREVNRAKDLIAECAKSAETSLIDDVAPLETRMHGSRNSHNTCRTNEADCQSQERDHCDKWDLFRKNTDLSACAAVNFHEHKNSDVPATKAAMEKCLLDLQPFYLKYQECSKNGDCMKEIAPLCDTNQTQFEKDFCIYNKLLKVTCQAQIDCRETHIAFRAATHVDVRANEASRKADHVTSQMVLCYFKVFESNVTNKSAILRGCEQLAVDTSHLNISYPAIPVAQDCDVQPSQPCDKDWLSAEYDSKLWRNKVTMLDCRPCPQVESPPTSTPAPTPPPLPSCGLKFIKFISGPRANNLRFSGLYVKDASGKVMENGCEHTTALYNGKRGPPWSNPACKNVGTACTDWKFSLGGRWLREDYYFGKAEIFSNKPGDGAGGWNGICGGVAMYSSGSYQIEFPAIQHISAYAAEGITTGEDLYVKTWTVKGSVDGSNWFTLDDKSSGVNGMHKWNTFTGWLPINC